MDNKFQNIYQDMVSKVIHGIYKKGRLIPSEKQLSNLYNTSRETIRKALREMAENGLIQKIQGKGTVVLDLSRYNFPISGLVSFKELNKKINMGASTKVLCLKECFLPIQEFGLSEKKKNKVTFIERLRKNNDGPMIIDQDYIPKDIVPKIPLKAAQNSLFEYFEKNLGLDISYAIKKMTVETLTKREAHLLNLKENSVGVMVRNQTYLKDTTLLQVTKSIHRPDKFSFIDFARRQKIS